MLDKDYLREIKERLKKISPAPWTSEFSRETGRPEPAVLAPFHHSCDRGGFCLGCISSDFRDVIVAFGLHMIERPLDEKVANCNFIAHARTDVQKLMDHIDRLEEALELVFSSDDVRLIRARVRGTLREKESLEMSRFERIADTLGNESATHSDNEGSCSSEQRPLVR